MSKIKNTQQEVPAKQNVYIKNSYTGPSMILIPPSKPSTTSSEKPKSTIKGK